MAGSKLYEITDIDFWDLTIEAVECDLNVSDVPEEDVFRLEDFKEFHVILSNGCNEGVKVVDFGEWVKGHVRV